MTDDLVRSTPNAGQILRTEREFWPSITNTLPLPIKTVLLAENDENDIFIMKMACEATGIPHQLQVMTDGVMAIDYLLGKDCYADRTIYPMPNVVFLDINMTKLDGFEVLKWIRAKPGLKKLPVIMLSSSTLMADVDRACQLGGYLLPAKSFKSGRVRAGHPTHFKALASNKGSSLVATIPIGMCAEAPDGLTPASYAQFFASLEPATSCVYESILSVSLEVGMLG
jgi:CheY-like chemotaxis protein